MRWPNAKLFLALQSGPTVKLVKKVDVLAKD